MKKVKIEPADQRIVVLPSTEEEKITAAGLYIPATAEVDRPELGTIIAAGRGSEDSPMLYVVGDKVMYSQYSGVEVKLNLVFGDKYYKVMNQMDVMAKIKYVE